MNILFACDIINGGIKMFAVIMLSAFNLILPLTMVICGGWFLSRPPDMNDIVGYRTKRSMASPRCWAAAHRICGSLWLGFGIFTGIFAVISGIFSAIKVKDADNGFYFFILGEEAFQLAFMLGAIALTEARLKKIFHN